MIYLFGGENTKKKLAAYEKFLKSVLEGAQTFFINKNDFDSSTLASFSSGTSLFGGKSTVVFHDILEDEEIKEMILAELSAMGESENAFIFLERKLPKTVLDAFKKARAELNVFEAPKEKKEKIDNFRIANSFAAKDKFNTWLYFRQAVEHGSALEELTGILFWKIKDMLLRRNFTKWKEEELKDTAARISYLLPEARTKGPEAEAALEQFLLEAF